MFAFKHVRNAEQSKNTKCIAPSVFELERYNFELKY